MESKLMSRRVYLDHNASTPVHPEVLAEMLPYFAEVYGNPSSIHAFGRAAREGMDLARERVARFLKVSSQEIVFTSGGTESDNFAVKGLAWARGTGHLITSQVENHAVIRACRAREGQGCDLTCVAVDEFGMVDPDDVRRAIRPDTVAISIMHANSEVGTIQPMEAIGRIAREHGIPFHVDAVQTFGKLPLDVNALGIDALSFSAHKIYGPKGVAGLFIRKGSKMVAVQHGGEHERRRRAGTENVAGIVGLGKAVEIRARDMHTEAERITALRDRLWDGVRSRVPEVRLSGHPGHRLPGTASFLVDHFLNPRNAGLMREPDSVGEDEYEGCGDLTRFFLRVRDGRAVEIRFQTYGCGPTIAAASMASELYRGRLVGDLCGLDAEEIERALEGLPDGRN